MNKKYGKQDSYCTQMSYITGDTNLKLTKHDIFPTPTWHIAGASQQLIDELYEGAYHFKERYQSANRSNEGGYQTPLLEWEEFHPQGREYVDKIVNDVLQKYAPIKVTSWWYNISGKGDWNTPHTHPRSDYALVFYVTDRDGLLRFMNPHQMRMSAPDAHGSLYAKKGDIILFPSDLIHYVMPNPREEDRISISMNLQLS